MSTEAQIRASIKYNKSRDYFGIRPDKETGKKIRYYAKKAGMSVQKYILHAVELKMMEDTDEPQPSFDLERKCQACGGVGYFYNGDKPAGSYSATQFFLEHRNEVKICELCMGSGLEKSS